MTSSGTVPRLEVSNISKLFGETKVLSEFSMVIRPGEIHGLVGENGSGKSTLVKILTGYHTCEAGGSVSLDGKALAVPVQWAEAHEAGISVVHQDLGLIDDLTVAENIGVGGYRVHGRFHTIDWKWQEEVAAEILHRMSSVVSPKSLVASLSASQRAEVAIARALRDNKPGTGLIILDESTRSLTRDEMARFYEMLRVFTNQGTSVLLVSHNLEEIMAQTDYLTVLQDGVLAGSGLKTTELSERDIVQRMLGREIRNLTRRAAITNPWSAVEVEGLKGNGIEGISFTIGRGEVVGITGLPGCGFEQIPYLLSGARAASEGFILINEDRVDLAKATVRRCARAGIALVPERREHDGLAFELSMAENMSLPTLSSRGNWWFVSKRWQEEESHRMSEKLGIRPRDPSLLIKQFSGGNQQKVLMGKWLSVGPKLLILHEPTQAVDVGAKQDILRQIHQVADTGVSVLVVSIDATDLAVVCDRIYVYSAVGGLSEIRTQDADEILDKVYTVSGSV